MPVGPTPVQARAVPTVASAIDAAIGLIEEHGEARLRLQDVTVRSGVSNGSLMHHFGTREGLIAAALSTRYDRAAVDRVRLISDLAESPEAAADGLGQLLAGAGRSGRTDARLARLRALSFARHRPALREELVASFRSVEHELAALVGPAQEDGRLFDGLSAGALAVFADTYAVGMLVDGALLAPLPAEDWEAFFLVLLEAVVRPAVLDRLRDGRPVAGRAAGGFAGGPDLQQLPPAPPLPPIPVLRLGAVERRVLDHAVARLAEAGPEALRVGEVCEATGVTRGWFARHLGDRDELIALVRLDGLIRFTVAETGAYEAAFAGATSGAELCEALATIVRASDTVGFLDAAWDRLDLLVAASIPGRLAEDASAVVRSALERISRAIAAAQARGVVRARLEPCAIARFLWALPVAFLLGDLVGVDGDELRSLADRTNATLCGGGVPERSTVG